MKFKQMSTKDLMNEKNKVIEIINTSKNPRTIDQNKSYLTKLNREINRRMYGN